MLIITQQSWNLKNFHELTYIQRDQFTFIKKKNLKTKMSFLKWESKKFKYGLHAVSWNHVLCSKNSLPLGFPKN